LKKSQERYYGVKPSGGSSFEEKLIRETKEGVRY
jgi:hypothetical protein